MAKGGGSKGKGGGGGRGDQPRDKDGQFAPKGGGGAGSHLMATARRVGSVAGRRVDRARMRLRKALDRVEKLRAAADGSPKAERQLQRAERAATVLSRDMQRVLSKPISRPTPEALRAKAGERVTEAKKRLVVDANEKRLKALRNRAIEARRRGLDVDTKGEMRAGRALLRLGEARADYKNAKWRSNMERDRVLKDLSRGTTGGIAKWTPAQREALEATFKRRAKEARAAPRALLLDAIRAARMSLR